MPTPDRVFMKRLKLLDRRLGVKWNGANFVITYDRGYGDPVNLILVQDEKGNFRQPDERELAALHGSDMERQPPRERVAMLAKMQTDYLERKRLQAKSNIRDMTKDGKIQLKRAFDQYTGAGKNNSAFRRVNPIRRSAISPA